MQKSNTAPHKAKNTNNTGHAHTETIAEPIIGPNIGATPLMVINSDMNLVKRGPVYISQAIVRDKTIPLAPDMP